MNDTTLHEALVQAIHTHPDYEEKSSPSSFLLLELNDEPGGMNLSTYIVDPDLPDKGKADAYLSITPLQRTVVELAEIVTVTASGVASIARQGPFKEELWEKVKNNKEHMCAALRVLSFRAATTLLEEAEHEYIA